MPLEQNTAYKFVNTNPNTAYILTTWLGRILRPCIAPHIKQEDLNQLVNIYLLFGKKNFSALSSQTLGQALINIKEIELAKPFFSPPANCHLGIKVFSILTAFLVGLGEGMVAAYLSKKEGTEFWMILMGGMISNALLIEAAVNSMAKDFFEKETIDGAPVRRLYTKEKGAQKEKVAMTRAQYVAANILTFLSFSGAVLFGVLSYNSVHTTLPKITHHALTPDSSRIPALILASTTALGLAAIYYCLSIQFVKNDLLPYSLRYVMSIANGRKLIGEGKAASGLERVGRLLKVMFMLLLGYFAATTTTGLFYGETHLIQHWNKALSIGALILAIPINARFQINSLHVVADLIKTGYCAFNCRSTRPTHNEQNSEDGISLLPSQSQSKHWNTTQCLNNVLLVLTASFLLAAVGLNAYGQGFAGYSQEAVEFSSAAVPWTSPKGLIGILNYVAYFSQSLGCNLKDALIISSLLSGHRPNLSTYCLNSASPA